MIDFIKDLIYRIKSKIRYHQKMKEIRKRDPYIYK